MELVLASNGCSLSDRFLRKLGLLAKHHDFRIIVDEIMTGARYGVMLLTEKKPTEFLNMVAFITLGKWMGVGMVIAHEKQQEIMASYIAGMPKRGMSTFLVCEEAFALWKMAVQNLPLTESRHDLVLSKLKLGKNEVWGGQLHIFGPVCRFGFFSSTKNRFLPQLDETPIESNLQIRQDEEWNKMNINTKIKAQVELWIDDEIIAYARNRGDYHIMKVIKHYVQHRDMGDWWFDYKFIRGNLLHETEEEQSLAPGDVTHLIGTLLKAEMLTYIAKYRKRRRVYEGKVIMQLPWKGNEYVGAANILPSVIITDDTGPSDIPPNIKKGPNCRMVLPMSRTRIKKKHKSNVDDTS